MAGRCPRSLPVCGVRMMMRWTIHMLMSAPRSPGRKIAKATTLSEQPSIKVLIDAVWTLNQLAGESRTRILALKLRRQYQVK